MVEPRHIRLVGVGVALVTAVSWTGCAPGRETINTRNQAGLYQLERGQSRAQVLETMGTEPQSVSKGIYSAGSVPNPYCAETHEAGGHDWEILYYATSVSNSDGKLTEDELTPVVLRDGRLDGWGWTYMQRLAQEYDIQRTGPAPPEDPEEGEA